MTLLKAQDSRDSEFVDVQDESKYQQSETFASENFFQTVLIFCQKSICCLENSKK